MRALRTLLETLPGDLPVTFREDFHRNTPVRGCVVLDDQVALTPYETP